MERIQIYSTTGCNEIGGMRTYGLKLCDRSISQSVSQTVNETMDFGVKKRVVVMRLVGIR